MAWRTIHLEGEAWSVSPAAEQRPNAPCWALVLSFRRAAPSVGGAARAVWVPFPLESPSRSALFHQADHLSEDALRNALADHLRAPSGRAGDQPAGRPAGRPEGR